MCVELRCKLKEGVIQLVERKIVRADEWYTWLCS